MTVMNKRIQRFKFKPHIYIPFSFPSIYILPSSPWLAGKAQAVGMLSAGFWVLSTPVSDSRGWGQEREREAELRGQEGSCYVLEKEEGITRRDSDPGCTR